MKRGSAVLFLIDVPTPQRTPTLDALASSGLDMSVVYMAESESSRGWGPIGLNHPHSKIPGLWPSRARQLINLIASEDCRVVCIFGYAKWEYALAFLAARFFRRSVVTRSDSNVQDLAASPRLKRFAKKRYLRALMGHNVRVWTIGSRNSAYWKELGFENQRLIPYEVPVLPGSQSHSRMAIPAGNKGLLTAKWSSCLWVGLFQTSRVSRIC